MYMKNYNYDTKYNRKKNENRYDKRKYQEVRESLEKMQGLDKRRTRINVKTMHTKSDNINTTIVSQNFGENKYSKIAG